MTNLLRSPLPWAALLLAAAAATLPWWLSGYILGILTVDPFYLDLSFITIAMLVVGGMFSLTGAVTGVVVVTAIVELLRLLDQFFDRALCFATEGYEQYIQLQNRSESRAPTRWFRLG